MTQAKLKTAYVMLALAVLALPINVGAETKTKNGYTTGPVMDPSLLKEAEAQKETVQKHQKPEKPQRRYSSVYERL